MQDKPGFNPRLAKLQPKLYVENCHFHLVQLGPNPKHSREPKLRLSMNAHWLRVMVESLPCRESLCMSIHNRGILRRLAWVGCFTALLVAQAGVAYSQTADEFNPGADGGFGVNTLAVQPDGNILAGGWFTTLAGQSRAHLGRLKPDGSLDATFDPGADGNVDCLAVQFDGKILVGGEFTTLDGRPCAYLGRLNTDGRLDTNFNPAVSYRVRTVVVQSDGKILVGGDFWAMGGEPRAHIGRLNADGTLDETFKPEATLLINMLDLHGDYGRVFGLALQGDGKILVGGNFDKLGGQSRNNIGRLLNDGSLDASFDPGTGADGIVACLAVQADGKVLVGGEFGKLNSQPHRRIGRFLPNGSVDSAFNPAAHYYSVNGGDQGMVTTLALQADGRILLAGGFNNLTGEARNALGRLNADGSLDSSFVPATPSDQESIGGVNAMALQEDGRILVGGGFNLMGGQSRKFIARLNNTEAAVHGLNFNGSSITWQRGTTSPEVVAANFAVSIDGANWISLGMGQRYGMGWQMTGLNYPATVAIRARGLLAGVSGSSWFVQEFHGSPTIAAQPRHQTNNAATQVSFKVSAMGPGPLGYQWRRGGQALAETSGISGTHASTLILSNVFGVDAAEYSVIVTNASGSVTSALARLTVVDPFITGEPESQAVRLGLPMRPNPPNERNARRRGCAFVPCLALLAAFWLVRSLPASH